MTSTSDQAEDSSFVPFTKAERIQQLNDIDKSITQLLQSAGLATKTLSAFQDPAESASSDRRDAFQAASNSYLKTLQSVDVRLRRQIYGLEEANIIPAEIAKTKKPAEKSSQRDGPSTSSDLSMVTEGTMGKLDIGWLNSRSGRVGRDMEAELWSKAKTFVEQLDEKKDGDNSRDQEMHD
ncbi:hypothetical protein BP6252_07748 [Coleophoma cylindrospora]|uniref:Mediator of RNA polymerase II transcription subunit 11 n=1 Tax=Coleophoma cylindrospora TaxID=1849047 RepID=A0A3D8RAZ6_9HELO|nr:hypothetical protein BP6252_07748 [Coleophoma cylindrospora]